MMEQVKKELALCGNYALAIRPLNPKHGTVTLSIKGAVNIVLETDLGRVFEVSAGFIFVRTVWAPVLPCSGGSTKNSAQTVPWSCVKVFCAFLKVPF